MVYGEHDMKQFEHEWHKRFKGGREDVTDEFRSIQPKTTMTADNMNRV